MKLESVFMPLARAQRDDFYRKSKRFVHYTSADNALKIIRTKRLWMRNTTCMADYREVQHGYDMLLSFFSDPVKREAFTAALDLSHPSAAMEAMGLFDQWWQHIRFNTYVSSISEHEDDEDLNGRLSMWRAFGGTLPKVAVVFRIPWYSAGADQLNLIFSPVAYMKEQQVHAAIKLIIENIKAAVDFLRTLERQTVVGYVFATLLGGVTCVKHEGFHEEREWRAIYTPKRAQSPLMIPSTEVIGGVPQIVYQLPLDSSVSPALAELDLSRMFDRLIVGPTLYPWAMYEAFVDALAKAGVPDPGDRVHISGIPLRA
jgi:hypothetical protein